MSRWQDALGKAVKPDAAAAQFPAFCKAANTLAPAKRSTSGRIPHSDAQWYIMTVAVEGEVPCQFPDVLQLALLLKTIPQSQAISERSGRQLIELEDPRRSRLTCKHRARAF